MELIKILDSNQQKLKFIKDAINPLVHVSMLGEFTFSFQCTLEYMDVIHHQNYVLVDDELFKIQKYKTFRTKDNQKLINVYCEQAAFKLINPPYLECFNYVQGQATQPIDLSYALNTLLQGSGFTYNVDSTSSQLFAIKQQCTKRRVLMSLAKAWGKEVKFHRFDITFRDRIGADNGVQYRVGKNIIGISKEVDDTQWDEFGNPLVSYEIEAIDQSAQYAFEKVDIGDTVKAIDSELKINLKTRVLEKEYNPITKKVARVVISNRIPDLTDYQLELEEKAEQNASDIVETQEQLDQTTTNLENQITETNENLSLEIQQTNDSLRITAEDLTDKYETQQAQIEIMPSQIKTSVRREMIDPLKDRVSEAESSITQQADQIESIVRETDDINGEIHEVQSTITQQADMIRMVVDSSGDIRAAEIMLAINDDGSRIRISADKIDIEGLMTFENVTGDAIRFDSGGYINGASGGLRFGYGGGEIDCYDDGVQIRAPGGNLDIGTNLYFNGRRVLTE
jgi:phage-related protein